MLLTCKQLSAMVSQNLVISAGARHSGFRCYSFQKPHSNNTELSLIVIVAISSMLKLAFVKLPASSK